MCMAWHDSFASFLCSRLLQIMVAIAEKQRRPEVPPAEELPGDSFSGLEDYVALMDACWTDQPIDRPTFESAIISLRGLLEKSISSR